MSSHNPINRLRIRLDLSERKLHKAIQEEFEVQQRQMFPTAPPVEKAKDVISVSNFARLLKEAENFDDRIVALAGAVLGETLALDKGLATSAMLAEHAIFKNELHGVRLHPESQDIHPPIVRKALFRDVVQEILYGERPLITLFAGNEKQAGRSALALAIAQFCAYDAPPQDQCTLSIVSLAQLDVQSLSPDRALLRMAAIVSSQLGLARRTGVNFFEGIASYFRYQTRPLLLLKDGRTVEDHIFRKFFLVLADHLPRRSPLKVLLPTEGSLLQNEREASFRMDYLNAAEMAEFIAWKIHAGPPHYASLNSLCSELITENKEMGKPAVATLLAGAYLLNRFGHRSPWEIFAEQKPAETPPSQAKEPEPGGISQPEDMAAAIKRQLAQHGHGNLQRMRETRHIIEMAMSGHKNALLTPYELHLLYALSVFEGSFTKAAAQACCGIFADNEKTRLRRPRFERALDRLHLSGTVTYERCIFPQTFSLEGETKQWLRNWKYDTRKAATMAGQTKRRYWLYIEQEIAAALEHLLRDPHAVDTADPKCFPRLMPEAPHIDRFLLEAWSALETNLPLCVPCMRWKNTEPPLLSPREEQVVWVSLLCANLALFWEAVNLPGTAIRHLSQAIKALGEVIEARNNALREKALRNKTSEEEIVQDPQRKEMYAILVQLRLSLIQIEVRSHREEAKPEGSNKKLESWNSQLKEIAKQLKQTKYSYGQAFHLFLRGWLQNRSDCKDGVVLLEEARDKAVLCIKASSEHDVIMMQNRQPISRYLAFTIQREIVRAHFRAGDLEAADETGRTLLLGANMTREPRLIADALIAMLHGSWAKAALRSEGLFSHTQLEFLQVLLSQSESFVAALKVDQATLRSHYLAILGIVSLEKSFVDAYPGSDYIQHRAEYSQSLFATSLSLVTDPHFQGVYFLFFADVYIRQALNMASDTEKGTMYRSLAAAYLMRSIKAIYKETEQGYQLSNVLKRLFQRLFQNISPAETRAAYEMFIEDHTYRDDAADFNYTTVERFRSLSRTRTSDSEKPVSP